MIPLSPACLESEAWQREMAEAVTEPMELLRLLDLDPAQLPGMLRERAAFPLRVPRYFVNLMKRGDPRDPLLAQVLPLAAENETVPGYVHDPVGDQAASHANGILQKYHGRALMVTTGACAVHCRYCFRRHFPYTEQSVLRHWRAALDRLRTLSDTTELILSGGDPLSLSDRRLGELISEAESIPQLQRLRIHTRLPVVLPGRVTAALERLLSHSRFPTVVVIHCNHPNEVSPMLGEALARLRAAGAHLLNQSVLLKSVNDDADTLENLSESLFRAGVMPYYLHLLDPVAGAAHFDVALAQARVLLNELQSRLPGYLVPRMVQEIAGEPCKTPVVCL
ncbi:MAG TPA: EF-P beta-lysylation protein EpmB [Gammaproteobacteria bacterium]|nr:EF-P beta-lysylation protein EpmB [Gammaproteobacteria bacterium]